MHTLAANPDQGKTAALIQITVMLFALEGALWTAGRVQLYWSLAVLACLIGFVFNAQTGVEELGISRRGFSGAFVAIPIALLASAGILAFAWWLGTLRSLYGSQPIYWHTALYVLWAFVQQFILDSFLYRRFELLLGDNRLTLLVTALVFSFVHIPNPVLIPATFLGGLFFVSVFRRWRNIYPLAIAHAILGLTLAMAFPDSLIRHMRVGLGFFRFYG